MDTCKVEPQAESESESSQTERNTPLLTSEKNSAISATSKPRNVVSRYKSGFSSALVSTPRTPRRSSSPTVSGSSHISRAPGLSMSKRSQSTEMRRPTTPSSRFSASSTPSRPSTPSSSPSSRPSTPAHDTVTEMLNTRRCLLGNKADSLRPSVRSLSSSFQSDSHVASLTKRDKLVTHSSDKSIKDPAAVPSGRKRPSMRGKDTSDQTENSKPLENHSTRVIDQSRWPSMMVGRLSKNIMTRSMDLSDKFSRPSSTLTPRRISPKRTNVSSNSASTVPRLLSEVAEQLFNNVGEKTQRDMIPVVDSPPQISVRSASVACLSFNQVPRIIGPSRPSSPSKFLSTSSASRGVLSPSRTRPSTPVLLSSNATSKVDDTARVRKCSVDVRRGKLNARHVEDAHQLKLLYNAGLQWRFINAQACKISSIQKVRTENVFHGVWDALSLLRDSIVIKRIDMQHLMWKMKLGMIIKEQMRYLEDWAGLENDHSSSLTGAVEALNSSTLRLPVTEGAKANIIDVREALSSAADVMQVMSFTICRTLFKVEGSESLVSKLSAVTAKEKSMLDECLELLAFMAVMEMQESSLRAHIMQLGQDARKLSLDS